MLTRMGAACHQAQDGQDCIQFLDRAAERGVRIDVILMDGNMPIMDGYEATKIIKAGKNPIPIIAVTGNALDVDVSRFMIAGADSVLTKPITADRLLTDICRIVPLRSCETIV